MDNAIIGLLSGGGFVFLAAIVAPIVSKRLNRATDAASNAERSAATAEKLSGSALKIVERLETDCARCDQRLAIAKRALESLIQVSQEILPLLPADHKVTDALEATLQTAQRALWD